MPKFLDKKNREWSIDLDCSHLKSLREVGLDLNQVAKDPTVAIVAMQDLDTYGQVMWTLLEDQAKAKEVTPEQFARGFDGPTRARGFDAFMAAFADFFHRPTVAERVKAGLPGVMSKVEKMLTDHIEKSQQASSGSRSTSGDSPGSLESIPGG